MTPNDIVSAGVTPNDRTWAILTDGSRWEYVPERHDWELVHRGLPTVAWQPTTTPRFVGDFQAAFPPAGV
jgi:hypothetical protein